MTSSTPPRRPRRLWKWLVAALAVVGLVVAVLPWLLASSLARGPITRGINRAFAPGRLEFDSIELSWFGPTRLTNVRLIDPDAKSVAVIPIAFLDRNLGQLITFHASSPITLDLDGTDLNVKRKSDGSIDLVSALKTIIAVREPTRHVTIRIARGTLRYEDPVLLDRATADDLNLNLQIPPAPAPITWDLKLVHDDGASLEIQGDFDHYLSRGGPPRSPELRVGVVGKLWPLATRVVGLDSTGKLDGTIDVVRQRGRLRLSGDTRLLGLRVQGRALDGDTLALDRLDAGWDLAEGDEGWSVRRLGVTSALGQLKAEGQVASIGLGKQRVEGKLDLAAIARQLPHALRLRDGLSVDRGTARLTVDIEAQTSGTSYEVEAVIADLAALDHDRRLTLRDPATLNARLTRTPVGSSVDRLSVKSSFLDASARGKLDEGVTLTGTVDLAGLRRQLGEWVDLGRFDLAGRLDLSGTYRSLGDRYESTLKATARDLRVEGVGPSVVRRDSGTVESSLSGLAESSGLPKGWDRGSVKVLSADLWVGAEARKVDRSMAWSANIKSSVTLSGKARGVEARLGGDWSDASRDLTFEEVSLSIVPGPGEPVDSRIEAVARGWLNTSTGELVLEPAARAGAIGVGPDGVKVSGLGEGLGKLKVDASLIGDLASLDRSIASWTGRTPMDLAGRWSAIASARGDVDGVQVTAKVGLDGTSSAGDRPTSTTLRAHYSPASDQLQLSELTLSTPFGTVDASGTVDEPGGSRRVDLKGTVAPDFAAINTLMARKVEPGARIEGKSRPFRATGPIGEGLDAEVGFDLVELDIYGMKVGPAPVVLHAKRGKLLFDPISTTLNEGHIRLEPEIDLNATGGPMLRLAKNSSIRDARINDEVSRRVLAYVAPILDRATRVSGRVTVDLDHAEFPIGSGRGRQAKVEGAVVFNDVEFAPGPLANDLLAAAGRRDLKLKLDQPLTLTIADGRINQRGLAIPIGELTRIEIAGWVDFDRNIALTASIPVTPAMLGNNELLADIAAGSLVRVPITGTLNQPKIDRDAMSANLQELGTSLITRGATRGAMELLRRLSQPKDPNAPPPPTPEERKERRMERKLERQEKRAKPPGLESSE